MCIAHDAGAFLSKPEARPMALDVTCTPVQKPWL
jgi:hypothetical protein